MPNYNRFKLLFRDVIHEIEQSGISRSEILYEILYSKRLLIEHVEILEEALYDIEKKLPAIDTNYVNPIVAGSLVTFTGITSLVSPKWLPLVILPAASYSVAYISKTIKQQRVKKNKSCLHGLLKSVEEFENVIKKHILFFNELQRFKFGQVVDDQMFVNTCIQCLRDVILVLYDATKELETEHVIEKKYETVYEQIEDLCQTEYFTQELDTFTSKNIKEFLKLFLYVQSQYLMRLGLIIAAGCDETFIQFNTMNLAPLIDEQTTNCNYNFDIVMFVQNPEKPHYTFKKLENKNALPPLLIRARSYCMTFVPKVLAIAHQCARLESHLTRAITNFDENDTDQDNFHELVPFLSQLDAELLACQEEFQRLHITYQKFLNMEPVNDSILDQSTSQEDPTKVIKIDHDYKKVGDTVFGHHDEFFALDQTLEPNLSESKTRENLLDEEADEVVNRKVVKRAFKPVLKQLKAKIEPLGEAMKERERKVLKEKGIEVDEPELSDFEMNETSSEEDERTPKKKSQSAKKYDEMREILQQKQQFNPFAMQAPPSRVVEEEFIE